MITLAIASVPYSSILVKDAHAKSIQKVQICGKSYTGAWDCVGVTNAIGNEHATLRIAK